MINRIITTPAHSLPGFLSSLSLLLLFSTILLSATPVLAETRYIKPSSEVVVRTGQGTDYKIVAMVKDGVSVEFLEDNDTYAKVRLTNGKEGWMLKRFLSAEPPLKEVIVSLRTEKEKIKQRAIETTQNLEEVSSTLARTQKKLDATLAERDQVRSDYQTLQQDTADVVQIKNALLKTTKTNEILTQKLASMEQQNYSLKKDTAIKWFLSGGGVLLVGMFIGMLFSQSRKRRSSLL